MNLSQAIFPVYSELFHPKLLKVDATETKATCQDCLRSRDQRFPYTYDPNLKCCTFWPFISNFAAGAVLLNKTSNEGTSRLKDKIVQNQFCFPIGLMAPYQYQSEFLNRKPKDFGRKEDLLCPYYEKSQNQCTIWSYRGVVCSTYFCRSDDGVKGQRFWSELNNYLSYVEMCLAEECLVQLDFSPRDISDQLAYLNQREFKNSEKNMTRLPKEIDKKLWNGYQDKEEFYKKCYQLVSNMTRKEFNNIMGETGENLEKKVLEYAHRRKN